MSAIDGLPIVLNWYADWLAFSAQPRLEDAETLHAQGITHLIDLTSRDESKSLARLNFGFKGLRIFGDDPPRDWVSGPRRQGPAYWLAGIGFSQGCIASGGKLLVHCWAGSERSPSMVLAIAVALLRHEPWQAVSRIRDLKPDAGIGYHDEATMVGMEARR